MDIKMIDTAELIPYENNPRINDGAIDAVVNSIKEFGFQQPIVIDKNNVIIVGHTRYKAALQLELDRVPCVVASELTEGQIRAYRLADNKTNELALWDYDKLIEELEAIIADDIDLDMQAFGFTDSIEHDLSEAESGYSPWTMENNEDNVTFTFGVVTSRLERELYELFITALGDEEVKPWLRRKLKDMLS